MKNNASYVYLLIVSLTVFACGSDRSKEEIKNQPDTGKKIQVVVPDFNQDSAYYFIQKQVEFGPRVPNTKVHRQVAEYFVETFQKFNWQVTEQDFEATAYDGTVLYLKNIIASHNPSAPRRILLSAHWDTRPFADKDQENKNQPIDGANDGGSGVGILLEIARIVSNTPDLAVGVDIILFDGEDYGAPESFKGKRDPYNGYCLGSQYWGSNKHIKGYSAYYGINLDMVGAEGARFFREGYSMQYAQSIVKKVWDKAHSLGHGQYFVFKDGDPITDDHLFVNEKAKIPMIDIIDYDPQNFFRPYHHTHDDNMELIDKNTIKAVGETVLHVVFNER